MFHYVFVCASSLVVVSDSGCSGAPRELGVCIYTCAGALGEQGYVCVYVPLGTGCVRFFSAPAALGKQLLYVLFLSLANLGRIFACKFDALARLRQHHLCILTCSIVPGTHFDMNLIWSPGAASCTCSYVRLLYCPWCSNFYAFPFAPVHQWQMIYALIYSAPMAASSVYVLSPRRSW
jgi:hypothetical protein